MTSLASTPTSTQSYPSQPQQPEAERLERAALAAAEIGPVLPVRPGAKAPDGKLAPRGVYSATTDAAKIRGWFNRPGPPPNIGIRTGDGLAVVDVDPRHGGSLDRARAEIGELPATYTVRTGGGGWHVYLWTPPGVEVRGREIAPGVELKGQGAYVLAAGSYTTGPYTVLGDREIAPAPPGLLEAAKQPAKRAGAGPAEPVGLDTAGGVIVEGRRNVTLVKIAGRLHDGTRTLAELEAALETINRARCRPEPLEAAEVSEITARIYARQPCNPAPVVSPGVRALLDRLRELARTRPKKGIGGHSNWAIYRALLEIGGEVGREHARGVAIRVDVRTVALRAGVGLGTVVRGLRRLADRGLVFRSRNGGELRAGELVLVGGVPIGVKVEHSTVCHPPPVECSTYAPIGALHRLRWGPGRIGKCRAAILEVLAECPGAARVELARSMGRKPDALKKPLAWLLKAGLITRVDRGRYALVDNFPDALAREREIGGEPEAERRDVRRYAEDRRKYRNRHKIKPDRAPEPGDTRRHWESGPARRRGAIERALVRLFRDRPEYRGRRVGQITCAVIAGGYIGPDFPRGVDPGGPPQDVEIAAILEDNGCALAV